MHDQLSRASFSIVLNIAKGSGKSSPKYRKNYFIIARVSIIECLSVSDILNGAQLMNNNNYNLNVKLVDELPRMLYAMIKNL